MTAASIDAIARDQFRVFDSIGDQLALPAEARRRLLLLTCDEWVAWSRVRRNGPVPQQPSLSRMLMRLGAASHRLQRLAERPR